MGITATVGGVRLKMRPDLKAGAATASPMIVQSAATVTMATGPRKLNIRCDRAASGITVGAAAGGATCAGAAMSAGPVETSTANR